MHYYNIRDLLGHFVRGKGGHRCPHKCCRGRRPHPPQKPLIPDRAVIRAMTDEQLAKSVDWNDPKSVKAFIGEAERRDRADARKRARMDKAARDRDDHTIAVEAAYLQAEHETRGNLLSKAGKAAGVDPKSLWTGSERRANKYASEELRAYFDKHGRLTRNEWKRAQVGEREALEAEDARSRRLYGVY